MVYPRLLYTDVWSQFNNILNGNWLSFCAGRNTINAMEADDFPATLFIHNGALSGCKSCASSDLTWGLLP